MINGELKYTAVVYTTASFRKREREREKNLQCLFQTCKHELLVLTIMTGSKPCLVRFNPTELHCQRRFSIYIDNARWKRQSVHFVTTISMPSTICEIHKNYAVTKSIWSFTSSSHHHFFFEKISISSSIHQLTNSWSIRSESHPYISAHYSSCWVLGFVLVQNLRHIILGSKSLMDCIARMFLEPFFFLFDGFQNPSRAIRPRYPCLFAGNNPAETSKKKNLGTLHNHSNRWTLL